MKKARIPALCVLLLFLLTVATQAGEVELQAAPRSGECGATDSDHVAWALNDAGTLTISGAGEMEDKYSDKDWDAWRHEITSVVVENGVVNVSTYAFDDFPFLEAVTIADTVKTIGRGAFTRCASLKTLAIGNGVTTIGEYAFQRCYKLEDFTFPDSLRVIEENAFSECYSLRNVRIPDSVGYIGSGAYGACKLNSVVFGKNVSVISNGMFYSCDTIKSITIPVGVSIIESLSINATPAIYYAGTETQWNAINGDGQAELTERAERIYFESNGTGDNAAFALSFPDVTGRPLQWNGNSIDFDINVSGNVMQPVSFFLTFYDENDKFLYAKSDVIKVSVGTKSVSFYIGDIQNDVFDRAALIKFMALDENFKPYCAPEEYSANN